MLSKVLRHRPQYRDVTGQTFGELTAIRHIDGSAPVNGNVDVLAAEPLLFKLGIYSLDIREVAGIWKQRNYYHLKWLIFLDRNLEN